MCNVLTFQQQWPPGWRLMQTLTRPAQSRSSYTQCWRRANLLRKWHRWQYKEIIVPVILEVLNISLIILLQEEHWGWQSVFKLYALQCWTMPCLCCRTTVDTQIETWHLQWKTYPFTFFFLPLHGDCFIFQAAAETESSNTADSVTIASQFLFYDERQIAWIECDGIVAVGWCAEKIRNQLTLTSGCWKIAAP